MFFNKLKKRMVKNNKGANIPYQILCDFSEYLHLYLQIERCILVTVQSGLSIRIMP